jgi:DNA-binding NtrC family response regulator
MPADPDKRSTTVLIVEDEPAVRRFVNTVLSSNGFETIESSNGQEALLLAQRKQPEGTVDVLLTDVVMPGIDGLELAETFAQRYPATRVVLMSGYPDFQHPRMEAIKRRWKLIPKPFHAHDLIEAIRSALSPRHDRPPKA